MRAGDIARLILLAAIWGSSFIFMRVLAPVVGAAVVANMRLLIAGVVMLVYFRLTRYECEWRQHWRHYVIIGIVNSSIPFLLYAFAALHIPASYSVIFNSTSPLFGAVFSAMWLSERLTRKRVSGLLLGATGVTLVSKVGAAQMDEMFFWAVAACLVAPMCYGLSGVYVKKYAAGVKPMAIAGMSQLVAGLALVPAAIAMPPAGEITGSVVLNMLALALLSGVIGYMLYYRLLADVGATRALTVTFLMPAFGMLWGVLFLGETITASMILGSALIVGGTALIARK